MQVGVRELKQQLSRYLALVAAGQEITVTDRGRPTARLVPLAPQGSLERGIEEGWITPPSSTSKIGPHRRHRASQPALDALSEDREG